MTKTVPPAKERSRLHVLLLVALLCACAGAVDTLGYFRLGRLFVANLTGNTVLFAYHAAARQWWEAAVRLVLVATFFLGVVTDRILKRRLRTDSSMPNPAVASLAIELCVLCVLAFVSVRGDLRITLLMTLAWAMGLQNDAFQKIGQVNLNTTFLTGDIEKLGRTVTETADDAAKKDQKRLRIRAFVTAWVAYVGGALLGAVGNHFFALRALLFPAVMVAVVMTLEVRGHRGSVHAWAS